MHIRKHMADTYLIFQTFDGLCHKDFVFTNIDVGEVC